MEFCMPVAMFLMAIGWLVSLALGFLLVRVTVDPLTFDPGAIFAFDTSGTSSALSWAAVAATLLVLSLLAAYLVQFMAAYHRREAMITRSATQVRVVTDAEQLLGDHLRTGSRDGLDRFFGQWADWMADLHESHLNYPGLVYHRSVGRMCWAKTAMITMDAAALVEAIAPSWAPVNATVLLDVGSACLQDLAIRIGIDLPVLPVSLHGREERSFTDTVRPVTESGLPTECDIDHARTAFQQIRARYAPYAVLIGARLLSPASTGEME
jgi:hypothetical protein